MEQDVWTIRRILAWIEGYLDQHGIENPRLSAQWLVAEALGVSRMQLYLDMDRPLTSDERAVLREYTKRRSTGEPLQYITGSVDFRHVTLRVRPGVLIPRPETEVLVSEALSLIPAAPKPQDALDATIIRRYEELGGDVGEWQEEESPGEMLVADLCTGTGCIACSLASEHSLVRVVATDIAPDAVTLARENVLELGLADRVEVVECDLATGVDSSLMGSFDLVVSNPPYVPTDVLRDLPHEVSGFEPLLALDGGRDGLDVFHRILDWCLEALKPDGAFAIELHETCLEQAAKAAEARGFRAVRMVDDLAGRPRVLTGLKAR